MVHFNRGIQAIYYKASNPMCGIKCLHQQSMLILAYHAIPQGINKKPKENKGSCQFWHIMPPMALNARIGNKILK